MSVAKRKTAVVDSGIAGMAAAWRLSSIDEVVVYEANAELGGHVCTVDVPANAHSEAVSVDVGFQLYHATHNPNVRALLDLLEVQTEAVAFSLSSSFEGRVWTNDGGGDRVSAALDGDIARFIADAPMMVHLPPQVSLRAFFDQRGYSADFRRWCLGPILSFWWVSRAALFELPAFAVAAGVLQGAISFSGATEYRAVSGGARAYIQRLAARLEAQARVRLATPVTRIERAADGVWVEDAGGGRARFDRVVLAVDAATALSLLAAPSEPERALLGSIRFEPSTLVVHRDERVMPARRELWRYGNFRVSSADPQADLSGEMTYWQPRPGDPSVFVTVITEATELDPNEVVSEHRWRHRIIDHHTFDARLSPIQGQGGVWYCGGHAVGLPVHEHALCSGLAVAEALGAGYPFADDTRAAEAYAQFKAHFM